MNNVHPLFQAALAPVAHPRPVVGLRPFSVEMHFNGKDHQLNTLAFTSCDAITRAIDIYFDGEDAMPDDLKIEAHPMRFLPAAA